MKKYLFILSAIVALSSCSCSSDIDMVKDSVPSVDLDLLRIPPAEVGTIGEAFDDWNSCKHKSWDEFENKDGAKIVEFSCEHKNVPEYFSKLRSFASGTHDYLDIESKVYKFQFIIKEDSTVQPYKVREKTQWRDGKSFEGVKAVDWSFNTVMGSAYRNEMEFDPSSLGSGRSLKSHTLSRELQRQKRKAK